ncbi:protein-L-isoaspartate(D-aspartate) O-methyltransferase [Aurantimonas sp. VKM B-3413]|uniref:protein-L-isoaspartate(D-aspartate) O-methyltransferase n=1 Tax=Aurantimonas sp. VKM B-3413 TaxID=2779401 RepID=UPI001E5ECBAB|nr:protein-L-isoaspartate(D-aspartate) O-methyltransferase [Aurantimonas sp. VKM B-3413]MCB8836680.1 protein-L-isoaspartate(D-aspartate) O-methyltransferase [Aurantimonas sp. VKM B-3413]
MIVVNRDRERLAAFVTQLRSEPLVGPDLMKAVESVPRRNFVPMDVEDPYEDRTAPIDCGETMPGALTAVRLAALLEVEPEHRVLEIGTGSGYLTALFARLGSHVTTFDRYRRLVERASQRLKQLGISNVSTFFEDGREGYVAGSPFHRIIAHAAFPAQPRQFLEQLGPQAMMICAIGPGDGEQSLVRLRKVGSRFERDEIGKVRYQPLGFGKAEML